MYHSWGSQNAWLRQIQAYNRLYINRASGLKLGLQDDDWVNVTSHNGQITCQVKLMEGVNDRTVWTWNAIGKRSGAWNLEPDAPEARLGFLLNHLISEMLPEQSGRRDLNSDPITGQAAWYDLRVRIEKTQAPAGQSLPQLPTLKPLPHMKPPVQVLRYGQGIAEPYWKDDAK